MGQKKKPNPKFTRALDRKKMDDFVESLSEKELAVIKHQLTDEIYWWMGNPTEERIERLFSKFPFLSEISDAELIKERLQKLQDFQPHTLGVHISDFMPELVQIRDKFYEVFSLIPKGIQKAELWLWPIAEEAGADADLEAAIYFASRGNVNVLSAAVLKERWYKAICYSIFRGAPLASRVTEDVKKRAQQEILPLDEAASILSFLDTMPRFFSFRDEENDFIDATFFRAVEWFHIDGFEQWVEAYANEISISARDGIDHIYASWYLFYICRSDLLLRKINTVGLQSLLWSIVNGIYERNKPWRQSSWTSKEFRIVDYIPIASSIVFAWHRIKPTNLDATVRNEAILLLLQSQLSSGAWPAKTDDTDGSIISTCHAIHALATAKPEDWQKACQLGRNWLLQNQEETGCWHIGGGPTVMLTVLALDAINLANGNAQTTFNTGYAKSRENPVINKELILNYSSEEWYSAGYPDFRSASLKEAKNEIAPVIAIVVATETELKQAFYRLKPVSKKRRIIKVPQGNDTYYIGRLGKHNVVLVQSAMGSQGTAGSTLTTETLIRLWKPKAIIMAGKAFGANKEKFEAGNVLVAESLIPYESQRVGEEIRFRSVIPPSSTLLLNRFKNALGWNFLRPDKSKVKMHFGPLLTGEKLIDNSDFKKQLLSQFPTAIGGEMEGAGLFAASVRNRIEWIVVKGVCDWADGQKDDSYQFMAAASAFSLCEFVLNDRHVLDGL